MSNHSSRTAGSQSRLALTTLEDRTVPALFGQAWVDGESLTVSYAKDGTDVAGVKSNLNAYLSSQMPTATWQTEIARAFQAWVGAANLNFRIVSDQGDAFGADLPIQGSYRAGDIRIAARPLSDNVLAVTNPFDLLSSWSGEIVLNSNKKFSVGGASGSYDLRTVMMHEVGHALGLSSQDTVADSVMAETYQGAKNSLTTSDVTAIQALYGARLNDPYEGTKNNDSRSRATPLAYANSLSQFSSVGTSTSTPAIAFGDLKTTGDVDHYKVTLPSGTTSLTATLKVDSISSLQARLILQDASGITVAESKATAPGQTLTLSASGLQDGGTYTLRVKSEGDAFAVGSYQLIAGNSMTVGFGFLFSAWYKTGGGFQGLEKIDGIVDLGKASSTLDGQWDVYGSSVLRQVGETNTYKVTTQSNSPPVMTVAVWSDGLSGLDPSVVVQDSNGKTLPVTVLRNNGSSHVIQIEGVKSNATYTVTVKADAVGPMAWLGSKYWMSVDYRETAVTMTDLAQGDLTANSNVSASQLTVSRSQLFRFELSADVVANLASTATISILDTAGNVVKSVTAQSGQTVTLDAFLELGTYIVRISSGTSNGTTQSSLGVHLRYASLTDPIGPALLAPTTTPSDTERSSGTSDTGFTFDPLMATDPLQWWW